MSANPDSRHHDPTTDTAKQGHETNFHKPDLPVHSYPQNWGDHTKMLASYDFMSKSKMPTESWLPQMHVDRTGSIVVSGRDARETRDGRFTHDQSHRGQAPSGTDRGLDPGIDDPKEIAKYLGTHGDKKFDYSKLWGKDTRVMMMGDFDHEKAGVKDEMLKGIEQLKASKPPVTAAAFEFLPQDFPLAKEYFDQRSQSKAAGKDPSQDKDVQKLREQMVDYIKGFTHDVVETADKYVKLMDAAQDAGMKIVGVEPSGLDKEKVDLMRDGLYQVRSDAAGQDIFRKFAAADPADASQASAALSKYFAGTVGDDKAAKIMSTLDIMKKTGFAFQDLDVPPKAPKDSETKFETAWDVTWRTKLWTDKIAETLKSDKDGRMIVIGGGGHFGYGRTGMDGKPQDTVDELLLKKDPSYKSVVIGYSGKDTPTPKDLLRAASDEPDQEARDATRVAARQLAKAAQVKGTEAARLAGRSHERFIYHMQHSDHRDVDYVIHIPE